MGKAVVITGDAARGAVQAGMLSVLPFVPDAIYGTSSGALNAALYTFARDGRDIEAEWLSIRSLFDIYAFNWLAALWRPGLFNNGPLELRMLAYVRRSAGSRCACAVPVTNLATGMTAYGTPADGPETFAMAVADSATIPGLCAASVDADEVDGGLRELAPIAKALEDGHDDIHLMLSRPYSPVFRAPTKPLPPPLRALSAGLSALDCMLHQIAWGNIQAALPRVRKLTVYSPAMAPDMHLLSFTPAKIRDAIEMGKRVAPVVVKDEPVRAEA